MAGITEKEAQKILETNGYKVLKHLGEGAASHAFEASRKSKKDPSKEKTVAAKVCCPQGNSLASLKDELRAATELKKLIDDFKKETRRGEDELKQKIEEAKKNNNQELIDQLEKQLKELKEESRKLLEKHFKYLTVPKFKFNYDMTGKGSTKTVAIFEAPLADNRIGQIVNSETHKPTYEKKSIFPGSREILILTGVSIDYNELKRVARDILKGLKVLHDKGKSHGDIRLPNILRKLKANKGKYRYSLTDFGTLRNSNERSIKWDLSNVSKVLVCLWQFSLYGGYSTDMDSVLAQMRDHSKLPTNFVFFTGGKYRDYTLTGNDKAFAEFCRKLYYGKFKSTEEALSDPWLKK